MQPIWRERFSAQEVIREFQVVTSGGGAEFGRAAIRHGQHRHAIGQPIAARGRVYEFFRDDGSTRGTRSPRERTRRRGPWKGSTAGRTNSA